MQNMLINAMLINASNKSNTPKLFRIGIIYFFGRIFHFISNKCLIQTEVEF